MDIKAEITKIVDKIKNDDELLAKFKKDPIKAVEGILGVDLHDDIIEKVVEGVKAKAEVLEHGKDDKLVIFKYKAKKNVHHRQGHRQPYSKLKIVSIG